MRVVVVVRTRRPSASRARARAYMSAVLPPAPARLSTRPGPTSKASRSGRTRVTPSNFPQAARLDKPRGPAYKSLSLRPIGEPLRRVERS